MAEGGVVNVRVAMSGPGGIHGVPCKCLLNGLSSSSPGVQMGRWPDGRKSRVGRRGLPSQAERSDPGRASRILRAGHLALVSKKPVIN